jgi:Flp pilus assembly protein TadD
LAPFNPEFKNKLGTSMAAMNRTDEALQLFKALILEDPDYAQAHCNLGYMYLLKGNPEMAEAQYNLALKLDPDYEQAAVNKAGLYIALNQNEKAKKVLSVFLKYHPGNSQMTTLLAKLNTL